MKTTKKIHRIKCLRIIRFPRKTSKGTQGTATLFVYTNYFSDSPWGWNDSLISGKFSPSEGFGHHLSGWGKNYDSPTSKWKFRLICKWCQNIPNTQNMHKLNLGVTWLFWGGTKHPQRKNAQNPFPKDSLFDHQHPRPSPRVSPLDDPRFNSPICGEVGGESLRENHQMTPHRLYTSGSLQGGPPENQFCKWGYV